MEVRVHWTHSFIHSFIVSVRNHPKMDLAEPQAVCLQARFLPEGVAQGTHEPRGNGQVAGLPQWTEVPSPRMNASHQVEETSELPRSKPPHTGS